MINKRPITYQGTLVLRTHRSHAGTPSPVTTADRNALSIPPFPWKVDGSNTSHDYVDITRKSVGPGGNTHPLRRPPGRTPVGTYEGRPLLNSNGCTRATGEETSRDLDVFTPYLMVTYIFRLAARQSASSSFSWNYANRIGPYRPPNSCSTTLLISPPGSIPGSGTDLAPAKIYYAQRP